MFAFITAVLIVACTSIAVVQFTGCTVPLMYKSYGLLSDSDTTNLVYSTFSGQVTVAGMVSTMAVTNSENAKPAFYLKPSVLYSSGDGSSSSPFYIKD